MKMWGGSDITVTYLSTVELRILRDIWKIHSTHFEEKNTLSNVTEQQKIGA